MSQPPPLPLMGIFPPDADYWAQPSPAPEDPDHPLRYGDLCIARQPQEGPALLPASWSAAMVVHPTCELTSNKAGSGVQVVRVTALADLTPADARSAVMLGYASAGLASSSPTSTPSTWRQSPERRHRTTNGWWPTSASWSGSR